jgi:hypothetical protein
VLSILSCISKKKEAPYTKEQYDYILTDLLKRKHAMSVPANDKKSAAREHAFNRLIDSIWKEQYSYYKK